MFANFLIYIFIADLFENFYFSIYFQWIWEYFLLFSLLNLKSVIGFKNATNFKNIKEVIFGIYNCESEK